MDELPSENTVSENSYALLEPGVPPLRLRFPTFRKITSRLRLAMRKYCRTVRNLLLFLLINTQVIADSAVPVQARRVFGLGDALATAVSPDLRFMASAGHGGIYIWEMASASPHPRLLCSCSSSARLTGLIHGEAGRGAVELEFCATDCTRS